MEFNKSFNPGAYPDRLDERDYQYSDIVFGTPIIDWEKGYDVEKELGITLKVEHQNGSSSCVGQAWAKYTEVIDFVETGKISDHSAKSIYEQIFLPSGGAYIRDGAKTIVNGGIALEEWISSYEDSSPPSEEYMRIQSILPEIREKMKSYKAKEYRSIGSANIDLLAHAIMNNNGAVSGATGDNKGWSGKNINDFVVNAPTDNNPWGHAFYWVAFGIDEKGKWFEFINSWGNGWGNNGRGRMYYNEYNMANNTFGAWTLVDLPNTELMCELIKTKDDPGVWIKWLNNTKSYIPDWDQFVEITPRLGLKEEDIKIIPEDELISIATVKPAVVIK